MQKTQIKNTENYLGRKKGARNKSDRYEISFMHPIKRDVCIETKFYKNLFDLAEDLQVSRYTVCRLLKKGGSPTMKIKSLRTVTVDEEQFRKLGVDDCN